MQYFLITVTLKDQTVHQGIRSLEHGDIDHAWILYKSKAEERWGTQIIDYNCVQLSKYSDHVKGVAPNSLLHKHRGSASVRKR